MRCAGGLLISTIPLENYGERFDTRVLKKRITNPIRCARYIHLEALDLSECCRISRKSDDAVEANISPRI